jgi:hypothetical protein
MRARVLAAQPYAPIPLTDNPLTGATFWPSRLSGVKVIGYQLVLLVWPRRTWARNADWIDEPGFWRSAAEAVPGSF